MRLYLSLAAALTATVLLYLGGCASPGYYSQAISGHLGLMRKREDLDRVIASGGWDTDTTQKLQAVAAIREFATTDLALPDNDSYSQFVATGREAATWNVIAAPEFSLQAETWCFPVAGCVPYRGYFDREKAERFATKMAQKNYETDISPAVAYSTLGWFDDPLLDTMLRYDAEQLAGIIFHELAHQQLYVRDDTAFNEAYASFVEKSGVQRWLNERGQPERFAAWQAFELAALDFNQLLLEARTDLGELYGSEVSSDVMRERKAERFAQLTKDYQDLVASRWDGQDYYSGWFARELNNARLALMNSYEGGSCAFDELFRQADGDFSRFHELATEKSRLDDALRTQWLNRSCEVIAPGGKL